eukprot:GILJ01007669.1.p1 GENE.GILJ01007669.1~~GILJ01007669.1.p1  ORF type:complete len:208 (-),score=26.64 GILJ01007669.1:412-1035(-)
MNPLSVFRSGALPGTLDLQSTNTSAIAEIFAEDDAMNRRVAKVRRNFAKLGGDYSSRTKQLDLSSPMFSDTPSVWPVDSPSRNHTDSTANTPVVFLPKCLLDTSITENERALLTLLPPDCSSTPASERMFKMKPKAGGANQEGSVKFNGHRRSITEASLPPRSKTPRRVTDAVRASQSRDVFSDQARPPSANTSTLARNRYLVSAPM